MKIKAGTGFDGGDDPFSAGKDAANKALARLEGETPALVMVFTTPRYALDKLLAGIRSVTGDALLVGCTSSGEIVDGDYKGFGAGVAVMAMTAGSYRFGAASVDHIKNSLEAGGMTIARDSQKNVGDCPYNAMLIFADSLLGDLQQLFQGAYRVTGPGVTITGGAAGDEQKFIRSFVFHNDRILEEGAVAVWIGSDHPLDVVTMHGWEPMGVPQIVTRAEGILIKELGGRRAIDVYREQIGLPEEAFTPENFWGTSVHYPLGLIQFDGSTIIRVARNVTPEGYLKIQGCVPPTGSAVQVMSGDADSIMGIAGPIAVKALEKNPDAAILLTFSCAARAFIFGKNAPEEPRRLQQAAGDVPIFGYYCCGEFARTTGVLGTHNATLTAIAL
jgi:hypothetical protein